jgi:hypothetical protein
VQPVTLDVMPANEKNPHAAADIVCEECKSIIATLHAPSGQQVARVPSGRQRHERWQAKQWIV